MPENQAQRRVHVQEALVRLHLCGEYGKTWAKVRVGEGGKKELKVWHLFSSQG